MSVYIVVQMIESQDTLAAAKKEMWGIVMRLKCDGTRAEIRFRLSAKRTS
jgi:hypothetical protein